MNSFIDLSVPIVASRKGTLELLHTESELADHAAQELSGSAQALNRTLNPQPGRPRAPLSSLPGSLS